MVYLILIYIGLSLGISFLGLNRNIGVVKSFVFCLLLTPVVGLLIVLHSSKKMTYLEWQYHCPQCGYNFTDELAFCPYCNEGSKQVGLVKEKATMT